MDKKTLIEIAEYMSCGIHSRYGGCERCYCCDLYKGCDSTAAMLYYKIMKHVDEMKE